MTTTPCKNNACEYTPTYHRQAVKRLSRDEQRYVELWVEIELPKLLRGDMP